MFLKYIFSSFLKKVRATSYLSLFIQYSIYKVNPVLSQS